MDKEKAIIREYEGMLHEAMELIYELNGHESDVYYRIHEKLYGYSPEDDDDEDE